MYFKEPGLTVQRLRVHATQEWHDLYQESTSDELQLFFDRYAKGTLNGFENTTPRVRVSLIGFNLVSQISKVSGRH